MATLNTQTLTTVVQNMVAAIQGQSKALINFTIGSVLRSILEAIASVVMWLQGLILVLLATTRAATSQGADLDSYVNDYGVTRLAAVAASGLVTFARFTNTQAALIPFGTQVQTADGTESFTVIVDATNPAYMPSLGGYQINAGVSSINLTVQANIAGSAGNVAAAGISVLTQAISGVDTVANASQFVNGLDAETDAALRVRFVAFIASLSKATKSAIGNAILSLQQGLSYTLLENQQYNGTVQMGYFFVVVDDGTGAPPGSLLSTVANAVDAVRPVTSTFGVFAPIVVTANVLMSLTTAPGYVHGTVVAQVVAALQKAINTLSLGVAFPFTRLAQIAYDASPGVTNVTGVQLNGTTADITPTSLQVIKAGTLNVS